MKPVVLIATHNREQITKRNIKTLLKQSVKPEIVLITSFKREEFIYDNVLCRSAPNIPLGNKWQTGVEYAVAIDANPLIITGSDDILGNGFIENACRLVQEGNHFIGLRRWWQHKDGRGYYCQYLAKDNQPLGAGRVFSAEMLKKINYRVFEQKANKHLDDLGWTNVKRSGLKHLVLSDPEIQGLSIHAIKGDWAMMNQFNIEHKNISLIRSAPSFTVLPSFFSPLHETSNSFIECVG